jgi:cellulose synthase (UDP-forming)
MIAAMALPHLVHANLVNSRTQGKFRHSFWAEVYEAVLAWYIFRPTMLALIDPKAGSFNVTAKGGYIERDFFDWGIARPYVVLLSLNLVGFVVGVVRLFWWNTHELDTVLLNMLWTVYNLVILGAAAAAASETRQVRKSHRVQFGIPARMETEDGRVWHVETEDFSEGGLRVRLPPGVMLEEQTSVTLALLRGDHAALFSARIVFRQGEHHGLRFDPMTLQQQMDLVEITFARADAWIDHAARHAPDRPVQALRQIVGLGVRGCAKVFGWKPRQAARPASSPSIAPDADTPASAQA